MMPNARRSPARPPAHRYFKGRIYENRPKIALSGVLYKLREILTTNFIAILTYWLIKSVIFPFCQ